MAGPSPIIPQFSKKDVEADDARFRRSNLGGDDLITKVVFALIVIALLAWFVRFWIAGHTGS